MGASKTATKPDFGGYATKAGLECADGLTIQKDAFAHQDGIQVPLVWQHGHNDPGNVLGHAILENRDDGVYAHCYFNASKSAQDAKEAVQHDGGGAGLGAGLGAGMAKLPGAAGP